MTGPDEETTPPTWSPILAEVAAERQRQVAAEGFDGAHDDNHRDGQLARAGACYALLAAAESASFYAQLQDWVRGLVVQVWPWGTHWLKPKDRRRNLIVAMALLTAEVERLDRSRAEDRADG